MRRVLISAAVLGAALLAVGICWAYADRELDLSTAATALLAAGTVLCVGSLNGAVGLERRPDGLDVPDGERLPSPHWASPLLLVGLCDLAGGLWSSLPMAVVGVVLAAAGLVALGLEAQRRPVDDRLDRRTVVAARRALAFARAHGGVGGAAEVADEDGAHAVPVQGVVEHVGRGSARLVVVTPDGAYGDVVVRDVEQAQRVAALARIGLQEEFSRELGAAVKVGPYEWERMAGMQLKGGTPGR